MTGFTVIFHLGKVCFTHLAHTTPHTFTTDAKAKQEKKKKKKIVAPSLFFVGLPYFICLVKKKEVQ